MYAKTAVKITVATSRTGALNWRADAAEKKSGTRTSEHVVAPMPVPSCHKDLVFYCLALGCVDQSWLHKLLKRCQIIF